VRRVGAYFDHRIESLSEEHLRDYFTELLDSHSWSTVKLDLYGFKFFTLAGAQNIVDCARFDQAAQAPAPARHRQHRFGAADICRHTRAELPSFLIYALQLGAGWAKVCACRSAI